MELISEELVEKTWKEASDFTPQRANREIQKIGRDQPDLLAFLLKSSEDLGSEGQELTIYLLFVVYRMFNPSGKKLRRVTPEEITNAFGKNQALLKNFGSEDAFYDQIATFQVLSQPYVMKYVSEALLEEDEDFSGLSEEENRVVFLLLKTTVDLLDKVTSIK